MHVFPANGASTASRSTPPREAWLEPQENAHDFLDASQRPRGDDAAPPHETLAGDRSDLIADIGPQWELRLVLAPGN
jgi:hypothetical protein